MKKIGFLINPIAGMGGAVGLKGTDGDALGKAVELGAKPMATERAKDTLSQLKAISLSEGLTILTCSGSMGEDALRETGLQYEAVYETGNETSAADTKAACELFRELEVDLILFCSGDGTARDIYSAVGKSTPILGIPAGVKMYSSIFTVNPAAAATVLEYFLRGEAMIRDAEIVDIDEDAYRQGILDIKIFGYASMPYRPTLVQGRKFVFHGEDEERAKGNIAKFASEFMRDESMYIVGAGTTTKAVCDALGVEKTLLGVDVVQNGKLIKRDVNEKDLLSLLGNGGRSKIIISPIGAQGFIFGRGNQQISPEVIRRVGVENVIIIATPYKLEETPYLFVDTGDISLDRAFGKYVSVVCGYRLAQRKEIQAAS